MLGATITACPGCLQASQDNSAMDPSLDDFEVVQDDEQPEQEAIASDGMPDDEEEGEDLIADDMMQ